MKRKSIEMLPEEVGQVAQKMSMTTKVKLVGSNSYRGMLYPSDVDLVANLPKNEAFVKHLQRLFKSKDYLNKVWLFMDFKAGIDHELVQRADETKAGFLKRIKPLVTPAELEKAKTHDISGIHWTVDEIVAGRKGARRLVDSLDGIVKLDLCAIVNDQFYDITEVYEIGNRTKSQVEQDLVADVDEYAHSNAMKSLKRMYAYLQHRGEKKRLQKKLVDFFNSPTGAMNKLANDIVFFVSVCEKHEIAWEVVQTNLQLFKTMYFNIEGAMPSVAKKLDKATVTNYKKVLVKLADELRSVVNQQAKHALEAMKI
jgi:hypothetical protein